MSTKKQPSSEAKVSNKENLASCSCNADPFASLPSELRPRPQPKKGGLRQVSCPCCGQEYLTNRATEICIQCESAGGKG